MENKIIKLDFEDMTNEELMEIQEKVTEVRLRKIENNIGNLEDNNKKLNKKIEILQAENDGLQDRIIGIEDNIFKLEHDKGKKKEWTKTIQSLAFKYNGNKNSLEYELFHRAIINNCYSHIYNIYQINTYGDIKLDEYDEAMTAMYKWFTNNQNIKRTRRNKLKKLRDDIDKGINTEKEEKLFNKFMELTGGII